MFYTILSATEAYIDRMVGRHLMRITRMRSLREDHDLKQKDIASFLGCSQVCYSYYEIGKREIPIDLLIKLADFYKTSLDYLMYRTDTPTPYAHSKQYELICKTLD